MVKLSGVTASLLNSRLICKRLPGNEEYCTPVIAFDGASCFVLVLASASVFSMQNSNSVCSRYLTIEVVWLKTFMLCPFDCLFVVILNIFFSARSQYGCALLIAALLIAAYGN